MTLAKLYLQNFRRFASHTFTFSPQTTLIHAPNGAGKTTILEAIYLLSTAKSFRAQKTAELLQFTKPLAAVYALTTDEQRLGITLTPGFYHGQKTSVKSYTLGKAKKRQQDFIGQLPATCFRPEDLRLIEGSSSRRRDYLDLPLLLTSPTYRTAHKNYHAALTRRNKTLTAIKDGTLKLDSLPYWNDLLLQTSAPLTKQRAAYLDFVSTQTHLLSQFTIQYQPSPITPERLAHYQPAELACGHSLLGPHKDDFLIETAFPTLRESLITYGSRGQHRLAVLWLKLAELAFLETKLQQKPLLLLDDIFSELDPTARHLILALIPHQQTIITTTEQNVIELIPKPYQTLNLPDYD